jgi:hypothetical protein
LKFVHLFFPLWFLVSGSGSGTEKNSRQRFVGMGANPPKQKFAAMTYFWDLLLFDLLFDLLFSFSHPKDF